MILDGVVELCREYWWLAILIVWIGWTTAGEVWADDAEPGPSLSWQERIDKFARPAIEKKNGLVGLVVGILTPDGKREFYCYGKTKADGPAPTPATLFEIGSVTKVFTALVLADMAERGEVKLDDPLSLTLPEDL